MRMFVLALLASSSLLAACNTAEPTGIGPLECPPEGTTLTYASYGQALLEQKCLGCHRPGDENPPLATQAQVQANRARILQEAVYTDAMPQDDDMSLAERERLGEWLACGAL